MSAPAPRPTGLTIIRGASIEAETVRLRSLAEVLANPGALALPRVVIPRLAWAGRVTLLAGREKLSGKSTLAAAGVAAATTGRAFLGEQTGLATAVWWSADREAEADVARRFVRFDANPINVYLPPYAATLDDVMHATRGVGGPVVLVVDTLTAATVGLVREANSASEWTPVLLALVTLARETDCAIVLLHHANKTTGEYRDSTNIGALVDVVCGIEAVTDDPSARVVASRGRWPTDPTFRVRLENGPDGDDYTLDGGLPALDARAYTFVQGHPGATTNAVCAALKARRTDALAALQRLNGARMIRNQAAGRHHGWYVVPVVPSVPEPPLLSVVPRTPFTPVGGGVSGTPAGQVVQLHPETIGNRNRPATPACEHPGAEWWTDREGCLKCGVCHPDPRHLESDAGA